MTETLILQIDPPLPCAVLNGAETCHRPARRVYAYPTRGPRPGVWLIMPICERCALESNGLYVDDNHAAGSQEGD